MDQSVKSKLKSGFTLARWGIDTCLGALFITIALIISSFMKDVMDIAELVTPLMIPCVMCILGLIVFAIGRVIVGLQSRKLHLHMDRPLTEEETWFVSCMLEIEETGSGVNYFNSASRISSNHGDDIIAGAVSTVIIGRFFKVGKRYMGHSFLMNRLPAIVSLVVAIIIVIYYSVIFL